MAASGAKDGRRGIVLWIVLSISVVLGILAFAFFSFVRSSNAQAHAVYYGEVAHNLAESGINLSLGILRAQLKDVNSELHRNLVTRTVAELEGWSLPCPWEHEKALLLKDMGDASLDVSIVVEDAKRFKSLAEAAWGTDPLEKTATVVLRSVGRFARVERVIEERRAVVVLHQVPPVLAKFTLFVREPEPCNLSNPGYNLFSNDIHGAPDLLTVTSDANPHPIVCYNHGSDFSTSDQDVDAQGWIYLGGEDPVVLNLTSGADYRYGQYFHFYNFLASDTSRQASFLNDAPPPAFLAPSNYGGQSCRFFLKHVIYGYFTVDLGQPPASMNRDDLLGMYFSAGQNMRSSVLHLYGTSICPSPTRVVGPVYQSYPIFSGVTVDVDGDGKRDGVVGLLAAVESDGYEELKAVSPLPTSIPNLSQPGETILLDPALVTYDGLFGPYDVYAAVMSMIVEAEPYNCGCDYLRSEGSFPPELRALDADVDYPCSATGFVLRRRGAGSDGERLYYQGDLANVDASLMTDRCLVSVADGDAFLARFVKGNRLRLGCNVQIRSGELRLPPKLRVEDGGLVVAPGNIRFDGIESASSLPLTLCSLEGNLVSPFNDKAQAYLLALEGKLRNVGMSSEAVVEGALAVKRLVPADLRRGGKIVFDRGGDPTREDRSDRCRVFMADRPRGWSL